MEIEQLLGLKELNQLNDRTVKMNLMITKIILSLLLEIARIVQAEVTIWPKSKEWSLITRVKNKVIVINQSRKSLWSMKMFLIRALKAMIMKGMSQMNKISKKFNKKINSNTLKMKMTTKIMILRIKNC